MERNYPRRSYGRREMISLPRGSAKGSVLGTCQRLCLWTLPKALPTAELHIASQSKSKIWCAAYLESARALPLTRSRLCLDNPARVIDPCNPVSLTLVTLAHRFQKAHCVVETSAFSRFTDSPVSNGLLFGTDYNEVFIKHAEGSDPGVLFALSAAEEDDHRHHNEYHRRYDRWGAVYLYGGCG